MEYNFLLLENDKLSIKKNGEFLSLNEENLFSLNAAYSLISTYEIKDKNSLSSKVLELLENNEVVINFEKVSSALKELEDIFTTRKGKVSSSLRVSRSYSESSGIFSDTLSGSISYSANLYDGGIYSTELSQAELRIKELKFEERRTRLSLRQQLEDAFSQYDGKVAAVSSKMLVLEGAKDSYGITKELYTFSRISLFEVLSAQEELFNSGKNLIDSIIDRAVAKYRLIYLCNQFEDIDGIK